MNGSSSSSANAISDLAPDQVLRIGKWRVDPTTNRMGRNGDEVHLEPKAMEVLLLLAARAGQVISREEILATLWSGSVVGDDTLTQAVIKLRKALGDDSRSPAYIETISKRGYRLVAQVDVEQGDAAPKPTRAPATQVRATRPRRLIWIVVPALLAVLLVVSTRYLMEPVTPALELPTPPVVAAEAFGGLPTITVLPFEPLGEKAPDYLASGIAADLATDLARLGELRVIRAPLAAGASGTTSTRTVARYAVSGSVQRSPERIKINVWLLDTTSGRQLWSERYERPLRDLIAIQEEIVGQLVRALPVHVSEAERRRLASHHTRNLEAYDLFLRAYAAHLTHQPEGNSRARALYLQAVGLDPTFARAYAGLAMTYADDYRYQWNEDGPASLKRAMDIANTAREINADVREVYWVLAYVHMQQRQPGQAIQHLLRAIELDPSYADAYAFMGAVYGYSGQPTKALPLLRYSMRLNPDAGYLYYMSVGEAYFFLGEPQQALLNLNEALARNPVNLETRVFLAATHAAQGNWEAAKWEVEEIRMMVPGFALTEWLETSPLTDDGQTKRIIEQLHRYGL